MIEFLLFVMIVITIITIGSIMRGSDHDQYCRNLSDIVYESQHYGHEEDKNILSNYIKNCSK